MKKILFLPLLMGALLAGCSSSDLDTTYEKAVLQYRQIPIDFGTFLGNTANTRAGAVGEITTTSLQQSTTGFGVFAYYTDNGDYVASGNDASPVNFMFNEQVTYNSNVTPAKWEYAPIKYWPNEFQTSGDGGVSANIDKLTFFAYAPWVGKDDGTNAPLESNAWGSSGIVGFDNNTLTGDPTVTYQAAQDPDESVDLLYATNGDTQYDATSAPNGLKNMTKPTVNTKVSFQFGHALSRLGMSIRAVVDETNKEGTNQMDNATTILLESITVQSNDMLDYGTLNLRTGKWSNTNHTNNFKLTVADTDIALTDKKVTTTLTPVLATGKYFMFIPSSTEYDFNVTVKYSVETKDPALAQMLSDNTTNGIKIVNEITNKVNFKPEAGKAYNFDILIGVTSVQVEANVATWTDSGSSSEIWVPVNR